MYVEVAAGNSTIDEINSSVATGVESLTQSRLELDDQDFGRAVVGWMLPVGRGSFLIAFEGHKENSYSFRSSALQNTLAGATQDTPTAPIPWWFLSIENGQLNSARTPPVWDIFTDDANGNGRPDPGEVRFLPADLVLSREVPDNLLNRVQTIDLLFQREFGGRRISGRWDVGPRYFVYKGNIPIAAWLSVGAGPGEGFTDGFQNRVLTFEEEATGIGPTFSLEIQFHFFRKRLTLYGMGRGAFLITSLTTDSGVFYALLRDPTSETLFPAEARLKHEVDKSTWNLGAELGVRVRILEGFHFHAAYSVMAYQDAVLLPNTFSIPENVQQVDQGTVALYNTQDLTFTTVRAGLSFQF
jgi:hypothetical protein